MTLPRFAQIVALCSLPLVAAYPFMKRITWWPQVWLGLTFNWAVLVSYAIKTGTLSPAVLVLYLGLMFWTVGYDTIYACQDIEDDAMIGVKSTARRFGKHIRTGVYLSYLFFIILAVMPVFNVSLADLSGCGMLPDVIETKVGRRNLANGFIPLLLGVIFVCIRFNPVDKTLSLKLFKSNLWIGLLLIFAYLFAPLFTESVFRGGSKAEGYAQSLAHQT